MNRAALSIVLVGVFVVNGCAATAPVRTGDNAASPSFSPSLAASAAASVAADRYRLGHFPTAPDGPLSDQVALSMQAIVNAAVDDGLPSISATVMAADRGVWSGVAGTADGAHPVELGSQFAIASLTKTVIAAQVLHLVETGHLQLGDSASDHLPDDFKFDTNGATIENLLAMESGIPDPRLTLPGADPQRVWTAREVLTTVPTQRSGPGDRFVYEDSNYMLLGLVIEEITGTSVATALRAGVLADPRLSALVYQPDEQPTGPLAMPFGIQRRTEGNDQSGDYLPNAALTSSGNGSGCMASDSASLALFGYLLFGGSLISEDSLLAMTDFGSGADYDGYGLGVFEQTNLAQGFSARAVGNGGWEVGGYSSVLVVLPSEGLAISVMTNTAGSPIELVMPVAQKLAVAVAG